MFQYRHQKAISRIRNTIEKLQQSDINHACIHINDVYINFPDGAVKRPDIAIFRREPEEQDEMITLIPEAVIEVVSKGYEAKDPRLAPVFISPKA